MSLARWMGLIGTLVGVGCLTVAQRTSLCLKGYAVGERITQVHAKTTELAWLDARVAGLASPTHLAQVAQDRHLKLVAWSTLSSADAAPAGFSTVAGQRLAGREPSSAETPATRLAAETDQLSGAPDFSNSVDDER